MCLKRLVVLLALCLVAGLGTRALAASFSDVQTTPYADAFAYLSEHGAVQGYSDGLGRPNGLLNRAEALKVLFTIQEDKKDRLEWMQEHMPPIPLFRDVDQTAWYAPYVEVAFENGVVKGYPDGSFRPGQLLRVEEAVALLMRSFGENGSADGAELSEYIENREGQWYTSSINAAITRNLVMHRGRLRVNTAITRGQFFDMVYRMHKVHDSGTIAYNGPEPTEPVPVRAQPTPVNLTQTGSGQQVQINAVQPVTTVQQQALVPMGPVAQNASEKPFSMSMPSLDIEDLAVVHPTDPFSHQGVLDPLKFGVGHLFGYPGGGGKVMIYGHSSGYPWDVSPYTKIFRKVNELEPGDMVYVTYDGNLYTYEVTHEETVPAGDTSRFEDDGNGEELILYTCWPPDSISERYLVFAKPVQTVAGR